MPKTANRVSLGAVHTHTHTCISREIKRVANEATLYCVEINYADYKEFLCNYHCLEILVMCFLRAILRSCILKKFYTELIISRQVKNANQGGVE